MRLEKNESLTKLVMEESFAMNGGDGLNSYKQNSKYQREVIDEAMALLSSSIQENLAIQNNFKAKVTLLFRIADLGCSAGPNTFACVEAILEAVKLKFKAEGIETHLPEIHVFFNDQVANDFNTLFQAFPIDRTYVAAGVPGSFHGRLFPTASMNLIHTSLSLHWLSRAPERVTQKESPAWNKGRISYVSSSSEVQEAYAAQFLRDMEAFFTARSAELADDGLLAILMPCRLETSESFLMHIFECLGLALADMVREGLVSEDILDSFNLPIYIPSASEMKGAVLKMKKLVSIVKLEEVYVPIRLDAPVYVERFVLHARAVFEGIVCKHFGPELNIDQLFERYSQKIPEFSKTALYTSSEKLAYLFLLVKRNA